jgi:hypothetical protein
LILVYTYQHPPFLGADEVSGILWKSHLITGFCDEEDNEISGKLPTAEHYSSMMKKATV